MSKACQTKAYKIILDEYDDTAEIVFAASRGQAIVASEWVGDFVDARVYRKPEYDQYAEMGYVPPMALLGDGWWLTCSWCERILSIDADDDDNEPDNYVESGRDLYCSYACMLDRYASIGRRHGLSFGARLDAVDRWPGIEITDSDGLLLNDRREQVGGARFRAPGVRGAVAWVRGADTIQILSGDIDGWRAFESALVPTVPASLQGEASCTATSSRRTCRS